MAAARPVHSKPDNEGRKRHRRLRRQRYRRKHGTPERARILRPGQVEGVPGRCGLYRSVHPPGAPAAQRVRSVQYHNDLPAFGGGRVDHLGPGPFDNDGALECGRVRLLLCSPDHDLCRSGHAVHIHFCRLIAGGSGDQLYVGAGKAPGGHSPAARARNGHALLDSAHTGADKRDRAYSGFHRNQCEGNLRPRSRDIPPRE